MMHLAANIDSNAASNRKKERKKIFQTVKVLDVVNFQSGKSL